MLLIFDFLVSEYFNLLPFFLLQNKNNLWLFLPTYLVFFLIKNSLFFFYSFFFYSFFLVFSSSINFYEIKVNNFKFSDKYTFIGLFNPYIIPDYYCDPGEE